MTTSNTVRIGLALLTTSWMAGCGGSAASKPQQRAEQEVAPAKTAKAETVASNDYAERGPKKKEGIPLDIIFFDEPLNVIKDNSTVAVAPPTPVPGTGGEKPMEKPATAEAGGGGAIAWNEMLPADVLQAEAKKIMNRSKGWLQGQGTYNGNYKDIAVDGSVMAALAGVAIDTTGDVSWKANAPYVREFGHELSEAATGLGKDNFEKSKVAFEKLESIFSGSVPADAAKAAPKRPFHETAGREGLMKRIEKAKNWMRDNINTEAKLKGETDAIVHEAIVIAALGEIVATEGYVSADEEDYQQFARALIGGAKEAVAAAKDQNFSKFEDSMNKVNKSCEQCHANYGSN